MKEIIRIKGGFCECPECDGRYTQASFKIWDGIYDRWFLACKNCATKRGVSDE
ncbi:MAG: hypothetical protein KJ906_00545 [Nanoarchaeota archaeon]|nr:hypothetical protein [Nanoarchaeota archaeon]